MAKVTELRAEIVKNEQRMRQILDGAEAEGRDLSGEESQEFDKLHAAVGECRNRIERQEKLDSLSTEIKETRSVGDYKPEDFRPSNEPEKRSQNDLALEGWTLRSLGGRLTPEHRDAMRATGADLEKGFEFKLLSNGERRDLVVSGGSAGEANIIRTDFVAMLERSIEEFGGILNLASTLRTDGGNPVVWPTANDLANVAVLNAEANPITGDDPAFNKVTFGAYKLSTMVRLSQELTEDAGFDIMGELASMLGERIARGMAPYLATGTGSGQPQGVVTGSSLGVTGDETSDGELLADYFLELIHSVDPAYRKRSAGFLMNDNTLLAARKLKNSTTGEYVWQPSIQPGVPGALFGYPVHIDQDMPDSEAAAKPVLFGDYSKFKVRLVRGVRLLVARELFAESDEVAILAHVRFDSKVLNSDAIKHLLMG